VRSIEGFYYLSEKEKGMKNKTGMKSLDFVEKLDFIKSVELEWNCCTESGKLYWIYYQNGYCSGDNYTQHSDTAENIKEVKMYIRMAEKCDCKECKAESK
jgi:hypothetical protein